MNSFTRITPERRRMERMARFNPIAGMEPELLTQRLDSFHAGYLAPFARVMDAIERRDYRVRSVAPKAKRAVARRQWEVLINSNIDKSQIKEAEAHKETLEFLYNNLRATNAIDRNYQRGFGGMVYQMMDAVGKGYAVHELLWRPTPDGLTLTANFVPLWFFENRSGELRFLRSEGQSDGEPMEAGAWMVHTEEMLGEATAVAWMYKNLSLKDWVLYTERHGMPGIQGKTDFPEGSDGWNKMTEAVDAIAANFACVTGLNDQIERIDLSSQGELPYPPLVEAMDRAIAALWRGADLSTMSAGSGEGSGASLQGDESELMEVDMAGAVSETLQQTLDKFAIEYRFGPGTRPLAYVQIIVPQRKDTAMEISVDTFLRDSGAPLGVRDTVERYGRTLPDPDEALLVKPAAPAPSFGSPVMAANEADREAVPELVKQAVASAAGARVRWLEPLQVELDRLIETIQTGALTQAELVEFLDAAARNLPDLFAQLDMGALADSLEDALGAAALAGIKEAKA